MSAGQNPALEIQTPWVRDGPVICMAKKFRGAGGSPHFGNHYPKGSLLKAGSHSG